MQAKCVGYLANGNVCRRPATHLDPQSGGMLCADCWQAKERRGRQEGRNATASRRRP